MAVDDVSVEVEPGQIRALIGPNGSGKTTVLQLLAGTLRPDAGRVVLDGRDITNEPAAARARLGVVRTLQGTAVFPQLTALENAAVGAGSAPGLRRPVANGALHAQIARARTARRALGPRRRSPSSGCRDRPTCRPTSSTAFDRRLLMIAYGAGSRTACPPPGRACRRRGARGPGRARPSSCSRLRNADAAVILVEHNLRLVRAVADHVTVLDAGQTIASGTPAEIAAEPSRAPRLPRREPYTRAGAGVFS